MSEQMSCLILSVLGGQESVLCHFQDKSTLTRPVHGRLLMSHLQILPFIQQGPEGLAETLMD